MEKDPRLINIYLKIHNKRTLTMDDLQYLAIYSPECFEKTCKNVVYNFPNAKPIMDVEETIATSSSKQYDSPKEPDNTPILDTYATEQSKICQVLENLRKLETNDMPQTGVTAKEVKNLLGNLFMELIFPHNDKTSTLLMPENITSVDFRV